MSAKEAIEKANKLHTNFHKEMEEHRAWWEMYQTISKKMGETHRALFEGKISVEEWKLVYAEFQESFKAECELKTPKHPDQHEWYAAKMEALQELGAENGLHLELEKR